MESPWPGDFPDDKRSAEETKVGRENDKARPDINFSTVALSQQLSIIMPLKIKSRMSVGEERTCH